MPETSISNEPSGKEGGDQTDSQKDKINSLKLFEDKLVRSVWDEAEEKLEAETGRKVVTPLSAKEYWKKQLGEGNENR